MTDTAKKAAAPKKAPAKPKAAKAAPAAKPTPKKAKAAAPTDGAVIRLIPTNTGGTACPARGNANGQPFEIPVGKDVPVNEAVLDALRNSHIRFEIVSLSERVGEGADEGSSAPSTSEEVPPASPPDHPPTPTAGGDGGTADNPAS